MIRIITEKKEIENYHKMFHEALDIFFTEKINCGVGYPGGSFKDTVKYSDKLNIWISTINNQIVFGMGLVLANQERIKTIL